MGAGGTVSTLLGFTVEMQIPPYTLGNVFSDVLSSTSIPLSHQHFILLGLEIFLNFKDFLSFF